MKPLESFIGQPVRSLQTMLRVLGEDAGRSTTLIPDGIYGRQTQSEVSRFQREHGLPITGVADNRTVEHIAEAYTPAMVRVGPAQPLQLILNPGQVFKQGDKGYFVYIIQAILLALAEIYSSMAAPDMTGIMDSQTAESVISFQYLSNLPQTGQVDKITWKHMVLQYPLAVNHIESQNRTRR